MVMQAIPLLLRQQLRSGIGFARTTTPSSPIVRPVSRISTPPTRSFASETKVLRELSVCNSCRFTAQIRFYSSEREGQSKDGGSGAGKDIKPERDSEPSDAAPDSAVAQNEQVQETSGTERGHESLPSEEEGRRSNFSKQFSSVMDNLQSNVFIAGQRLNDLTGYSAIEALKRDIQEQGRFYTINLYSSQSPKATTNPPQSTKSAKPMPESVMQRKPTQQP